MKAYSASQLWQKAVLDIAMLIDAGLTESQITNHVREKRYTWGRCPWNRFVIDRVSISSMEEVRQLVVKEELSKKSEDVAYEILDKRLSTMTIQSAKNFSLEEGEEFVGDYRKLDERTEGVKGELGAELVYPIYLGTIGFRKFSIGGPRFLFTPKRIEEVLEYSESKEMRARIHLLDEQKTGRIFLSYKNKVEGVLFQSGYLAGSANSFQDIGTFLYYLK